MLRNHRSVIQAILYNYYVNATSPTLVKLYCYSSFIRPHLEYAAIIWNPMLNIDSLENVQKYPLRVSMKSWNSTYEELLMRTGPQWQVFATSLKLLKASRTSLMHLSTQ